jgi:hypothetical protein
MSDKLQNNLTEFLNLPIFEGISILIYLIVSQLLIIFRRFTMSRKFLTVFVAILFLLPILSFAQTRALLFPDGDLKIIDQKPDGDVKKMNQKKVRGVVNKNTLLKERAVQSYLSAGATPDTLSMRDLPGGGWTGFGLSGQQWWIQWFVAPADLNITGIGVAANSIADPPGSWNVEYKIVKMAWTEEQLLEVTTAGGVYLGFMRLPVPKLVSLPLWITLI